MSGHKHICSEVEHRQASQRSREHPWVGRQQRGLQSAQVPVGKIVAHYWEVAGSQNTRKRSIRLDQAPAETCTELVTNYE
jgi:hypothetical protein